MKHLALILITALCVSCSTLHGDSPSDNNPTITVTLAGKGKKAGDYELRSGARLIDLFKSIGVRMEFVGGRMRPDSFYTVRVSRPLRDGSIQKWKFHCVDTEGNNWREFKLEDGDRIALSVAAL